MTSKEMLQGSFLKFLWYVFTHVLALPPPTRVQLDIARYLEDGPVKRFIQAFRGVGKSFLTCCYVVWRLWKNPNLKILIVSANEKLALENATLIKLIIDHPAGDDLWAELRTQRGQRSSTMAFDVGCCVPDKSPSVKVVGITGQLTGSRSDILISDDVEVPKNSATEAMRDKLRELTAEYAAIAKPGSEIIYLGTPQSHESIYRGMRERGYDIRIWPARYPTEERLARYDGSLAPLLVADIEADPTLMVPQGTTTGGRATDPKRFSELDLLAREEEYRAAGFLLQYQLDTSLSDADRYPLKTRNLIVLDVDKAVAPMRLVWGSGPDQVLKDFPNVGFDGDRLCRPMWTSPDFVAFTGSVMYVDPSGRGKDETAYCVTKFLNGYVFVRRWGGFRDGFGEETLRTLADIAAEEEVNLIMCEDNMGDGMFRRLLEPYVQRRRPCPIEGYKVTGQKELRILSALEPALAQHRVVIDASAIRADLANPEVIRRGLYQLTHLTSQRGSLKHDDRVDILAAAVKHWADHMNADATKAEEAWKRKQEAAWEKEFFKGTILGHHHQGDQRHRQRATGRRIDGLSRRGTSRRISW
ncbi:MAG: phage terminase large subunit [Phenylobacterium sp.]|uniref:phage terminase large subunit n=1 Tax=Phenylobacterium sp. TaxID=1871053 RepID=UPI00391B97B2